MPSILHPDLSGRVAIVTGASRGIGKALALRLAAEGAAVVVAAKSQEPSERLPGSIHETVGEIRAQNGRPQSLRHTSTSVRGQHATEDAG